MKERLKEVWYWFEDKLKGLCGELTPDKRIVTILIMLLILTIGNLHFTFSTIYNWGKESEKKEQMEIEHIRQLELEQNKSKEFDFMDSEMEEELFDLHRQKMRQDSIDSLSINKQRFKEYERTTRIKPGAKTKA
ncbi:hypothetical protein M2451_002896 [Dysgonomonas sp. PFB1-18]|uniref:TraL conjugative transposon family protein n=1 Tax=unclassified Dysgonomonas TaxID=2630389 RepID=UPI0013D6BC4F|nr:MULTISPECIES: TraL conjugative transposon family protein [unclassified Dysgonomonas]MDH6310006.1 hypothetical protein [Dysgonomonas sp. PF1-14]MDH6339915.1 hypothetical protein [Dysgonomonas sp. PF1-16]MDH6381563.1 hypothetical protein [Dysgonomonas sp. PFB1-18]MDH6398800.1 hypothetical protein [Dysgonomonas sp. PF1-23]NDV93644.1 DUF3989 domain-containing protein [Dysgonomonas sp. 521]